MHYPPPIFYQTPLIPSPFCELNSFQGCLFRHNYRLSLFIAFIAFVYIALFQQKLDSSIQLGLGAVHEERRDRCFPGTNGTIKNEAINPKKNNERLKRVLENNRSI